MPYYALLVMRAFLQFSGSTYFAESRAVPRWYDFTPVQECERAVPTFLTGNGAIMTQKVTILAVEIDL